MDSHDHAVHIAAWVIATAAHRARNPHAGDFAPHQDRGHQRLLDAATEFVRDPYAVLRMRVD
jgi:hypothetical protein